MSEGHPIKEKSTHMEKYIKISNIRDTVANKFSLRIICLLMLFIRIQTQEDQQQITTDFEEQCLITPYNFVAKCNITCESCDSDNNDHGACRSCPSYLSLAGDYCRQPVGQDYDYREYFMNERISDEDELQLFRDQQGTLNEFDVIKICIANRYRFEMLGPFEDDAEILHNERYSFEIKQMAINFRVFFLNQNATIFVKVNNEVVYIETILSGKSMADDFIELDNSTYLTLVNDPTDYIDKLFIPVKTGLFQASGFNFKIEIIITSEDDNTTNKWLFNEFNVIGVRCTTCISAQVDEFTSVLAIIIGVSILCILIILCIIGIYLKLESRNRSLRKRSEFQKKIMAFKRKYRKGNDQTSNVFKTQSRINTQNKLLNGYKAD